MIQTALKHGCKMGRICYLLFPGAIRKGDHDVVELLTQEGSDPRGFSVVPADVAESLTVGFIWQYPVRIVSRSYWPRRRAPGAD